MIVWKNSIRSKSLVSFLKECVARGVSGCIDIDTNAHFCTDGERDVEVCNQEYDPVCGWFYDDVECDERPCAVNAPNPCEACINEDVEFWTEGECPEDSSY